MSIFTTFRCKCQTSLSGVARYFIYSVIRLDFYGSTNLRVSVRDAIGATLRHYDIRDRHFTAVDYALLIKLRLVVPNPHSLLLARACVRKKLWWITSALSRRHRDYKSLISLVVLRDRARKIFLSALCILHQRAFFLALLIGTSHPDSQISRQTNIFPRESQNNP